MDSCLKKTITDDIELLSILCLVHGQQPTDCLGRRNFKDTNPKMSSLLVIFLCVKHFECKTPAEYGLQQPPTLPSHSHTLSVYTVCLLWGGGGGVGGGQREGRGATVHKWGRNTIMNDCISSI
jgi:hypothetical protein